MRICIAFGIILGIFVLAVDVFSKALVVKYLSQEVFTSLQYPYGGIGIYKDFFGIDFSLIYTTNKGAAWGVFPHFQTPLLILRLLLILGLIYFLFYKNQQNKYTIPLCLVIAGAVGNVIDTLYYGEVIDMFKVVLWGYHFPIFNVADSAITIGIIWLFIASIVGQNQPSLEKNG